MDTQTITHEQCYAWAIRIGEEIGTNVMALAWDCKDHEGCDTAHMLRVVSLKSYDESRSFVLWALAGGYSPRASLRLGSATKDNRRQALEALGDEPHADEGDDTGATLHDYATADEIRPATREEFDASLEAARHDGGAGVIVVEIDGEERSCYVMD